MGPLSCCRSSQFPFNGGGAASPRSLRIFSHDELSAATSDFSPSTLLGRGSHGSVFLASLDSGRLRAAAKLPSTSDHHLSTAADAEINLLSSLPRSHHLVNLVGATPAAGPRPRIAVVDLMPHGSLHDLLHGSGRAPPPFAARLLIASRAAAALAHLHSLSVAHRDVKPSNLLLDSRRRPRLADFGLAVRISSSGEEEESFPAPAGTMGYLDPAYLRPDDVSTRTDVYSFGVVLLEILSGRKAIDVDYSPPSLVEWAAPLVEQGRFGELWDPRGPPAGGKEEKAAREVAAVAMRCVEDGEGRPAMAEVVARLRDARRRTRRRRLARWARGSAKSSTRTGKVSDVAS